MKHSLNSDENPQSKYKILDKYIQNRIGVPLVVILNIIIIIIHSLCQKEFLSLF